MVTILFTKNFEKELKKHTNKTQAKEIVKKLMKTKPTDGDSISIISNVLLKERKLKSFRFYFIQRDNRIEYLTKEELKEKIIQFVTLSKKNNQQKIIDQIKNDIKNNKLKYSFFK